MSRNGELLQRELPTTLDKIKKAGDAYKSARFYVWVGLTCGFALIGIEHLLKAVVLKIPWIEQHLYASVLDGVTAVAVVLGHLGIGFIVAAIAVFFYEWGAHIKETLNLSNRLVGSLDQAKHMMEAIRMSKNLTDLNVSRAKPRLHYSINTLIGGAGRREDDKEAYLRKAATNCEKLVLAISDLYEKKAWANDQYISFIANNLEEFVVHNAEAFSKLAIGLQTFRAPLTAAQMADEILVAQMRAMEKGDRYDVISELDSWQGNQLEDLHTETQKAIEQGNVQVRRVFNMLPYIYSPRLMPPKSKEILRKHLEASEAWRGETDKSIYEVKLLWTEGSDRIKNETGYSRDEVRSFHFGLFVHDFGREIVRFSVTQPDLSDMTLCRTDDNNKPFVKRFDAVWRAASPIPKGESIIARVDLVFQRLDDEKEAERQRQ